MSKTISNGQNNFDALKELRIGGDQSIRNNDQLIRLLPADMTEQGFFEYKSELASRINGFDIDVECEKSLVSKEGTVIIAPLSTVFKQELSHSFFARAHNVEPSDIKDVSNVVPQT
jgi:hypothetical protein